MTTVAVFGKHPLTAVRVLLSSIASRFVQFFPRVYQAILLVSCHQLFVVGSPKRIRYFNVVYRLLYPSTNLRAILVMLIEIHLVQYII